MPLTKKAERTKAKLTASARKLISERGFDNVSVEEITKDAGVAKGTFYHYFVCKEDVVREFSTRVIEEIFTTAMTMPGGPQEKLTYYFNAILHEADRMGVNLIRQWIRDISLPAPQKKARKISAKDIVKSIPFSSTPKKKTG